MDRTIASLSQSNLISLNNKKGKKTNPFSNICSELFNTINERSFNPLENSYTNHLLTKGSNTILKKIGEESAAAK